MSLDGAITVPQEEVKDCDKKCGVAESMLEANDTSLFPSRVGNGQ